MTKLLCAALLILSLLSQPSFSQLREKRVVPIDPQESRRGVNNRKLGVAVLVGIGHYSTFGGLSDLRYTGRDVDTLASELTAEHYSVVMLKDSEAYGRAMQNAVKQAGELLDPDQGTLIFFFSGHGFAEGGVNYLASFDAEARDLARTGVSVSSIEQAMINTGAKRRVMWIDACRNEPGKGVAEGRSFARFTNSSGTRILFSTKAGRISYEDDQLQQGLFSYFLVKGLQGAAAKDDGLISFRDLADFVADQVGTRSLQAGHVQVPYEAGESSGDFLIARARSTAPDIGRPSDVPPPQKMVQPPPQTASGLSGNSQKNYKDRREYDLFSKVTQTANLTDRMQLLNTWDANYPSSDFGSERLQYFVATLQQIAPKDPRVRAQLIEKCKELLQYDPGHFQANYLLSLWGPDVGGTSPSPDLLITVETAAKAAFSEANIFFDGKKPAAVTVDNWASAKVQAVAIAHNALAWVGASRGNLAQAENEYRASLTTNPNQGNISAMLAKLLADSKDENKYPDALFEYARAAQYTGPGLSLSEDARAKLLAYFKERYVAFHGGEDGENDVLQSALVNALPPVSFTIRRH